MQNSGTSHMLKAHPSKTFLASCLMNINVCQELCFTHSAALVTCRGQASAQQACCCCPQNESAAIINNSTLHYVSASSSRPPPATRPAVPAVPAAPRPPATTHRALPAPVVRAATPVGPGVGAKVGHRQQPADAVQRCCCCCCWRGCWCAWLLGCQQVASGIGITETHC